MDPAAGSAIQIFPELRLDDLNSKLKWPNDSIFKNFFSPVLPLTWMFSMQSLLLPQFINCNLMNSLVVNLFRIGPTRAQQQQFRYCTLNFLSIPIIPVDYFCSEIVILYLRFDSSLLILSVVYNKNYSNEFCKAQPSCCSLLGRPGLVRRVRKAFATRAKWTVSPALP